MILVTSDDIGGRQIIQTIGLVRGNSARARGIGYDFTAAIRNIFGGAVPEYANLITQARDEATERMVAAAQEQGDDAIVTVRYTTSMVSSGVSEILAFGTAVKLR